MSFTYSNNAYYDTTASNHILCENSNIAGAATLGLVPSDNFLARFKLYRSSNNATPQQSTTFSFGDATNTINLQFNSNSTQLLYGSTLITQCNTVPPYNTLTDIALRTRIDNCKVYVGGSLLMNTGISNLDFQQGSFSWSASNTASNLVYIKYPAVESIFTLSNPTEFIASTRMTTLVASNITACNLTAMSNSAFSLAQWSSNHFANYTPASTSSNAYVQKDGNGSVVMPANASLWITSSNTNTPRLRVHHTGGDGYIDYCSNLTFRAGSNGTPAVMTLSNNSNVYVHNSIYEGGVALNTKYSLSNAQSNYLQLSGGTLTGNTFVSPGIVLAFNTNTTNVPRTMLWHDTSNSHLVFGSNLNFKSHVSGTPTAMILTSNMNLVVSSNISESGSFLSAKYAASNAQSNWNYGSNTASWSSNSLSNYRKIVDSVPWGSISGAPSWSSDSNGDALSIAGIVLGSAGLAFGAYTMFNNAGYLQNAISTADAATSINPAGYSHLDEGLKVGEFIDLSDVGKISADVVECISGVKAAWAKYGGASMWCSNDMLIYTSDTTSNMWLGSNSLHVMNGQNFTFSNTNANFVFAGPSNVGIGCVPDSTTRLHIRGSSHTVIRISASNSNVGLVNNDIATCMIDAGIVPGSKAGDFVLRATTGCNILLGSTGVCWQYLKNDGSVGIGTSNPSKKLHVSGGDALVGGAVWSSNGHQAIMHLGSSANSVLAQYGLGVALQPASTTLPLVVQASTGFVGISNSAPAYPLDVSGAAMFRSDVYMPAIAYASDNMSTHFVLRHNGNESTNSVGACNNIRDGWHFWNKSSATALSNATPLLSMSYTNQVGIGTTYPQKTLDVVGDVGVSGSITSASATTTALTASNVSTSNMSSTTISTKNLSVGGCRISQGIVSMNDYTTNIAQYSEDIFAF